MQKNVALAGNVFVFAVVYRITIRFPIASSSLYFISIMDIVVALMWLNGRCFPSSIMKK